jgi:hypothetical protein
VQELLAILAARLLHLTYLALPNTLNSTAHQISYNCLCSSSAICKTPDQAASGLVLRSILRV